MKKTLKYVAIVICTLLLCVVLTGIVHVVWCNLAGPPRLVVSERTTHITEPLSDVGYVDYPAAYNNRFGRGVTPDENAFVDLLRVFGPGKIVFGEREVSPDYHEFVTKESTALCKALGIEPVPLEGDWFLDQDDFLMEKFPDDEEKRNEIYDSWVQGTPDPSCNPWNEKDYPLLAEWLDRNDSFLDRMVEASRRKRWFHPVVCPEELTLIVVLYLDTGDALRSACSGLIYRAMFRLGRGEIERAWEDISATARLGRLSGATRTLAEMLVSSVVMAMSENAMANLLADPRVSPARRKEMFAEYKALPPLPPLHITIDTLERWIALESMIFLERTATFDDMDKFAVMADADTWSDYYYRAFVDLNIVLPIINEAFDRLVRIAAEKEYRRQREMIAEFEEELEKMKAGLRNKYLRFPLGQARRVQSEVIGELVVLLMVPANFMVMEKPFYREVRSRMLPVVVALCNYRDAKEQYPERLDALVPDYLEAIPVDLFHPEKAPIGYVKIDDGFLLYSVGENGEDESQNVMTEDGEVNEFYEPEDDISLRVGQDKPVTDENEE